MVYLYYYSYYGIISKKNIRLPLQVEQGPRLDILNTRPGAGQNPHGLTSGEGLASLSRLFAATTPPGSDSQWQQYAEQAAGGVGLSGDHNHPTANQGGAEYHHCEHPQQVAP